MTAKLAYSIAEAAVATGYSVDVIRRAIRAGNLATQTPKVDNRKLSRAVILAADLEAWVRS